MGTGRLNRPFAIPLQVAAVCYRREGLNVEFLLVQTNGSGKWTFPKGSPEPNLSHSRSAALEAWEEGGVRGRIEPRHFHMYLHSKGVFWKPPGVQEYVVKAFLLRVDSTTTPQEQMRNPTWFSPDDARKILARGREVKYARELQAVIDRALVVINAVDTSAVQSTSSRPSDLGTRGI